MDSQWTGTGRNSKIDKTYVVGVVSHGYKCGEEKFGGVYARVTEASDWKYKALQPKMCTIKIRQR